MAVTLRKIKEEDLAMIMRWRMSEAVTRYMNTDPKLTLEGQRKWLASVENNPTVKYWLIEVDETPAGVMNLAGIDREASSTGWGYYIGEEKLRSLRLAISLEMSMYGYVFDTLGLSEIHNEVFSLNEGVWKLHLACGCHVVEEVKGEIEKNGIKYDMMHLLITKDEWYAIREKKKYEKINFDV